MAGAGDVVRARRRVQGRRAWLHRAGAILGATPGDAGWSPRHGLSAPRLLSRAGGLAALAGAARVWLTPVRTATILAAWPVSGHAATSHDNRTMRSARFESCKHEHRTARDF